MCVCDVVVCVYVVLDVSAYVCSGVCVCMCVFGGGIGGGGVGVVVFVYAYVVCVCVYGCVGLCDVWVGGVWVGGVDMKTL